MSGVTHVALAAQGECPAAPMLKESVVKDNKMLHEQL
jgi:hypothetical protein